MSQLNTQSQAPAPSQAQPFSMAAFKAKVAPPSQRILPPVAFFVDPVESVNGGYRLHLGIQETTRSADGVEEVSRSDFYSKKVFTRLDEATAMAITLRQNYRSGQRVPNPDNWELARDRTPRLPRGLGTRAIGAPASSSLDDYVNASLSYTSPSQSQEPSQSEVSEDDIA